MSGGRTNNYLHTQFSSTLKRFQVHRSYSFASSCLVGFAFIYLAYEALRTQSECNSADSDPVRDLNNFLQARKDGNGNFSRHLSWFMTNEGPDNQKIHYATAKCEPFGHSEDLVLSCAVRGQEIGHGMGVSMGAAKQKASEKALQYLSSLPANHSSLSTQ
jgi:hypothetical protein